MAASKLQIASDAEWCHAERDAEFDLSEVPDECASRRSGHGSAPLMVEIGAAVLVFLSIGAFLAHTFNAFNRR